MEATLSRSDSGVVFRARSGADVRGTLLHLAHDVIVFEVYGPAPIVQAGETVASMRILQGGRTVYEGAASVGGVVSTGRMAIVTAVPSAPWNALDGDVARVQSDTDALLRDWDHHHRLLPEFQLAVANLRSFLVELSQWLAPIDVAAAAASEGVREQMLTGIAEKVYEVIEPRLMQLWGAIEQTLARLVPEDRPDHRNHLQRELHPLLLCCPLVHRTYTKPLGYAGDYGMVNMILRNGMEGPSTYARVTNAMFLRIDVAQGHRNRIARLVDTLRQEVRRASAEGRALRVWSVGCGPAEEVCRFIRADELAGQCEFVLLDFNAETLSYAREQIGQAMRDANRWPKVELVQQSVNDLLKDVARGVGTDVRPEFDLAYCAGLFDYLSDRVCARLLSLMAARTMPAGLVVATNVHRRHTSKAILDELVEWHLILRSEADLMELAAGVSGAAAASVGTEPAGTNVFLEVRRADVAEAQSHPDAHGRHRRGRQAALGSIP